MRDEEFDRLFGERLAEVSAEPDGGSFDDIMGKVTTIRRKRRMVLFAGTFLATLVVASAAWLLTDEFAKGSKPVYQSSEREAPANNKYFEGTVADASDSIGTAEEGDKTLERQPPETFGAKASAGYHQAATGPKGPRASFNSEAAGAGVPAKATTSTAQRVEWRSEQTGFFTKRLLPKQTQLGSFTAQMPEVTILTGREAMRPAARLKAKPPRTSSWSVYAEALPFFSYNIFHVNTSDDVLVSQLQQVPQFSWQRLGARAEAGFEFQAGSKWRLQTGLLFFSRSQEAHLTVQRIDSVVVTSAAGGYQLHPTFSSDTIRMSLDMLNVGWLLGTQVQIADGGIVQWLGVSAELHRALKRNLVFEELVSGTRSAGYYTFANLFYRAEYRWKPWATVFLQPTFNYSLYLGERFDAPVNVKPYGFGVSAGIRIGL